MVRQDNATYSLTEAGWHRLDMDSADDVGQLLCALSWMEAATNGELVHKFRETVGGDYAPDVIAQHGNIADNMHWHLQRALDHGYIAAS